ncbi:phage tail tape measure protein [Leuconostoc lactis]|uniref:phage tail tape measure protein n=1 Tax=Leuconostoc lactis TaxID=1246 RepID=UPI003D6BA1B5
MAGSRIKGITIEIDGDTKGLDKALGNVNQSASKTQQELRDVNKLLKLDPGNTDLIAQKQKLLAQAISQTSDKLGVLKSAQSQVEAQFKSGEIGEEQYRAFQREVAATEASLKGYKSQLSTAQSSQQELGQSTQRLQNYFKATGTSIDDFKSVLGTRLVSAIKDGTASSEAMDRALQMIAKEAGVASSDMSKLSTVLDGVDDSNIKKASQAIEDLGTKSEGSSGKMSVFKGAVMAEGLSQVSAKAAEAGGAIIETAMEFGNAHSSMQNSMGLTAKDADLATGIVKDLFANGMVTSVGEAEDAVKDVVNSFGTLTNSSDWGTLSNNLVAISQHGGVDMRDAANASSQAMKAMGLTGIEATDLIAQGLQDGLNKNDDFLDTVNEYAPTFQDAGISAGGMLAILNEGMAAGAFNTDKVADAVKEFQLRLTSGQLDEPMQKFGKATQDVFSQFKQGKATSAEVMSAVGQDLATMPADKAKAAVQGLGTQFEDLGQNASSALLSVATQTEETTGATKKMSEQTPGEKWTSALNTLKLAFSDVVIQMTPLISKLGELVNWFNNLSPTVKLVIGVFGAISAVMAMLAPVITMIVGIISTFGAVALLPLIGIIVGVIAVITGIILAIKNWGAIVDWLKGVWQAIADFFSILWAAISEVFTNTLTAIGDFITTKFNQIKDIISTVWNAISSVISSVVNAIASVISSVWDTIVSVTTSVFNTVANVISSVWNNIKSVVSSVVNVVVSAVSGAWNTVVSVTSSVFNSVMSVASSVWNAIKSTISSVVNGISSTVSGVWNSIMSVTTSVWNGIKSAMTGPIEAAKGVISGIVNTIKGLFNFHLSFPAISIPHIPLPHFSLEGSFNPLKGQIPHVGVNWYAKGGIFTKPTMFAAPGGYNGVGEAGPEAALPLNAKTLGGIGKGIAEATGGLGGDTYQITIQVLADTSAQTIKKITDAVSDGITRAQNSKARALGGG